jgi:hypothetical protein
MANDSQFKLKTLIVGTRGVSEYRASIPSYIFPNDKVLEIGCEWGTTTEILAKYSQHVLATDISLECLERARQMRPTLRFEKLDISDIRTALSFEIAFTKMYIDVSGFSGYKSFLDVVALCDMRGKVTSKRGWLDSYLEQVITTLFRYAKAVVC